MSPDVQATFCATLIDQWIALGLRHAVVAPGSRSTPVALRIAERDELDVHVVHDERSAAFVALGIGLTTGVPALLLCTSGTAATHFHAAVVEAHLSNVPMLVITADRPPELRDVAAPQTIDQTHLFGDAPRWFHDPGVAAAEAAGTWRSLAGHAWAAALGIDPGPVHLNLPFREPLLGRPGELSPPRAVGSSNRTRSRVGGDLAPLVRGRSGVLVAGRGVDDVEAVGVLAGVLGWPVLADPRSGCRTLAQAVSGYDSLLRHPGFAGAHQPECVIRLGEPPASKVLAQWLAGGDAVQVQVDDSTRIIDPDHLVQRFVHGSVGEACTDLAGELTVPRLPAHAVPAAPAGWPTSDGGDCERTRPASWLESWLAAEQLAQTVLERELAGSLTEPSVARALTAGAITEGTQLVVASSMPIRDVEWFGGRCEHVQVHSNRGANGIDGVIATGIGVAIGTGRPTVVLLGDVAFCHDASSLTGLAARGLDLTIVVVDNDGGGIFSFLPQADALAGPRFEQLFGTPHGTDLVALAAAHGLRARSVTSVDDLLAATRMAGTTMVRVASDRHANVAVHRRLTAAVGAALP